MKKNKQVFGIFKTTKKCQKKAIFDG